MDVAAITIIMGIIAIVVIRANMAITCINGIIAIAAIIVIFVIITLKFCKTNVIEKRKQPKSLQPLMT